MEKGAKGKVILVTMDALNCHQIQTLILETDLADIKTIIINVLGNYLKQINSLITIVLN